MTSRHRMRVRARHTDFVLDVGSGGHPHSSADILVDRFIDDNTQHRGGRHLVMDRPLVCADIVALPFADKAFDYVICNQVVEHIPDTAQALRELSRVGQRGFVATPSEFAEFITPHTQHLWVFARQGHCLLMKRKRARHGMPSREAFGGVFWALHLVPAFKRLMKLREDLFWVRLEWDGEIEFKVLDDSQDFYDYHDHSSFGELLRPTPPSTIGECARDWIEVNLSLETVRKVGAVRSWFRRLIR